MTTTEVTIAIEAMEAGQNAAQALKVGDQFTGAIGAWKQSGLVNKATRINDSVKKAFMSGYFHVLDKRTIHIADDCTITRISK